MEGWRVPAHPNSLASLGTWKTAWQPRMVPALDLELPHSCLVTCHLPIKNVLLTPIHPAPTQPHWLPSLRFLLQLRIKGLTAAYLLPW